MKLGERDAIHVPYIVVHCKEDLQPGQRVSLRGEGSCWEGGPEPCVPWGGLPDGPSADGSYLHDTEPDWHGIVDPFLDGPIAKETPFRCFIREQCFSNMKHTFRFDHGDWGGSSTCHSVCNITG